MQVLLTSKQAMVAFARAEQIKRGGSISVLAQNAVSMAVRTPLELTYCGQSLAQVMGVSHSRTSMHLSNSFQRYETYLV